MSTNQQKPNIPPQKKKPLTDYARYSGIAFQMIAVILLAVWVGLKMDEWLHVKSHLFTFICTLLGVVLAIYLVIKGFLKK